MKITLIAGARPNFMKIAPIIRAIEGQEINGHKIEYRLVHTGQHYDKNMSETFFRELNIPEPDVNLGCGGGTQAEQTAAIMVAFEKYLLSSPTDLVMVVGDVTSTLACSIVAKKLNIKVAHVEAGIRSYDLTMPEEINRMVTDALTDYFFTTTESAGMNLLKNGIPEDRIFFVGNVMIDTLLASRSHFRKPKIWDDKVLERDKYFVLTLHRPNNVDNESQLQSLLEAILDASHGLPLIFPVHPRTAKIISSIMHRSALFPGYTSIESHSHSHSPAPYLHLIEPLGYMEFNFLVENSKAVITDSGGITEETTVMGIPCITLRNNTERPETVSIGTNELIGTDPSGIKPAMDKLFAGQWKKGRIPDLWDGKTSERIIEHLRGIHG